MRDPRPDRAVLAQGSGVDLVGVADFAQRVGAPGSAFPRVFTDAEWASCLGLDEGWSVERVNAGGPALGPRAGESLAARWAAKEAAVKAWSAILIGQAPPIHPEELDWSEIEVVHDLWRRPLLRFRGRVGARLDELAESLDAELDWSLSLSHDSGFALALVHVLAFGARPDTPGPQ
ncbi:4'-phosphopantetheinyl transferase superfamily protein [Schaalia hyovaginalis]|uniref:Holo-[acyl-carrier-protein] synthase n=1 Tax=Schaalia hyovaginalis TaxID=29316 RepID=A0A923E2S2_9ACTO|nr:4'-phosphopantetheinyl transferase superfamily protein [Schaalia hyovaginalis]MBB6333828.1 holo-[acyl-carrier protein] synthase [Schaalia hyovaginalis]MDY2668944.1 4'-phosphopantetheinyl transferase superfamily protein [Schaalia hyovaginalis]